MVHITRRVALRRSRDLLRGDRIRGLRVEVAEAEASVHKLQVERVGSLAGDEVGRIRWGEGGEVEERAVAFRGELCHIHVGAGDRAGNKLLARALVNHVDFVDEGAGRSSEVL